MRCGLEQAEYVGTTMVLGDKSLYGILVMAQVGKAGTDGQLTNTLAVSEAIGLGFEVCRRIVRRLVEVGLLESTRGKEGGIRLSRSAADVSLFEIADALDNLAIRAKRLPGLSWDEYPEVKRQLLLIAYASATAAIQLLKLTSLASVLENPRLPGASAEVQAYESRESTLHTSSVFADVLKQIELQAGHLRQAAASSAAQASSTILIPPTSAGNVPRRVAGK
jgi:DNA-binding IscR family transcriptional regulator